MAPKLLRAAMQALSDSCTRASVDGAQLITRSLGGSPSTRRSRALENLLENPSSAASRVMWLLS
jgi:hypothetical protein